jgi:hypothetical protein
LAGAETAAEHDRHGELAAEPLGELQEVGLACAVDARFAVPCVIAAFS